MAEEQSLSEQVESRTRNLTEAAEVVEEHTDGYAVEPKVSLQEGGRVKVEFDVSDLISDIQSDLPPNTTLRPDKFGAVRAVSFHTQHASYDSVRSVKDLIREMEEFHDDGAPVEKIIDMGSMQFGEDESDIEREIEKLRRQGEVYEPMTDRLRTT